jgi:hypothetical protein
MAERGSLAGLPQSLHGRAATFDPKPYRRGNPLRRGGRAMAGGAALGPASARKHITFGYTRTRLFPVRGWCRIGVFADFGWVAHHTGKTAHSASTGDAHVELDGRDALSSRNRHHFLSVDASWDFRGRTAPRSPSLPVSPLVASAAEFAAKSGREKVPRGVPGEVQD